MTLKRGTSFTGVPSEQALSRSKVKASDLDSTAADQAYVYEKLTNKNADGSGGTPPTNVAHKHAEGGNALYWPLMHQVFGCSQDIDIMESLMSTYSRPLVLSSTSTGSAVNDFILFAFPVYISEGVAGLPISFVVEATGDEPRLNVRVKNSTLTMVDNVDLVGGLNTGDGDEGQFLFYNTTQAVDSAGLWVFEVTTSFEARAEYRRIHSFSAGIYVDPVAVSRPHEHKPPTGLAPNITTVQPAWQPIDSIMTTADFPLGPAALLVAQNNARVYEEATGLPAPGNATATADGHNHDGSNSAAIAFNLASFAFGSESSSTQISGNNSKAPQATNNTYDDVAVVYVRCPVNVNNAASLTSKLKAAVYTYSDSSKAGFPQVQIATTGGGASASFYTATANDYNLMSATSGATSFSFTSGGYNQFIVSFRSTSATPASAPKLLGWCLYFED